MSKFDDKWKPVDPREWGQFFALEVSSDWLPVCAECVDYANPTFVVNYFGGSPYLYSCKFCGRDWADILDSEEN